MHNIKFSGTNCLVQHYIILYYIILYYIILYYIILYYIILCCVVLYSFSCSPNIPRRF